MCLAHQGLAKISTQEYIPAGRKNRSTTVQTNESWEDPI